MKRIFLTILFLMPLALGAQSIATEVPDNPDPDGKYIFYFHGGVVTAKGDNAINDAVPEWGPYQYSGILDTLSDRGFLVISEIRKKDVHDSVYVNKLVRHVNKLLDYGVKVRNITIVGASAGTAITVFGSSILQNNDLKFVLMGGCWPETHKDYAGIELYGKFLSIIEESDPHGTCYRMFEGRPTRETFREISLATGLSHGFIYRGIREWVDPVVAFANSK